MTKISLPKYTVLATIFICNFISGVSASVPPDVSTSIEETVKKIAQPCAVCIEGSPRLMVSADGTASGVVAVCNRTAQATRLALTLSDFSAIGDKDKPFPLGATRHLSAKTPSEQAILEGTQVLVAERCLDVAIDVSGIWQAGLLTATLKNGTSDLGVLEAIRRHAPFGIKVDGPNPDKVELLFVKGKPAELRLRNDDEMGYRFRWRLELPDLPASDVGYIQPNRSVTLDIPKDENSMVSGFESGFLRSATREGQLVVEYDAGAALEPYAMPRRVYPVHATISSFSADLQRLWNTICIVVLLIAGIAASLLINYALPMQRRRVEVKQRLALLEGRLAGLGALVPARILSMLRVEKRRLREELRHMWPVDPTTEAALPKFEAQIDWIDKRIGLVAVAGEHLGVLSSETPLAVPQADQVRESCRTVFEIVAKFQASDDDIKRAQTALVLVGDLRAAAMIPPTPTMLQALADSASQVRTRVVSGRNPAGHETAFDELVTALLLDVPSTPTLALSRAVYTDVTLAVAKAEVVADFKHLLAGAQSADVLARRTGRAVELLGALCPGPEESLERARSIVHEAEQGVSDSDLVAALRTVLPQDLWIDVDPPKPLPYQTVALRVRLRQPGLDNAVARCRVECSWQVTGGEIESEDWVATYFFEPPHEPALSKRLLARLLNRQPPPAPAPIQVSARLSFDGETPIQVPPATVPIEPPKSYFWASAWLSLGTMLVTMLLVGIGLIAGAQEKIQSLDWVAGVFAILVLGFGADALKRVLTKP